jgi:mRNA interferase RelE/StbE
VPASYSLRIKQSAEEELRRLPKKDVRRIAKRIESLGTDPRPAGCLELFGNDAYRIRQGDYRILYTIDDERRLVEVYKIGHRREVYRQRGTR